MKSKKVTVSARKRRLIIGVMLALMAIVPFISSCNVTRTITTQSSSIQRGDTSVIIQSKTIESYNAMKH